MTEDLLRERMLSAWIGLNALLKDSRMTENLTYNEAVVMKLVYDGYRRDGVGRTAVADIVRETRMLKSLVNRTVNSLCSQGYLTRERDGRSLYVLPREERLGDFLEVHNSSLQKAQSIIDVIGEEDAESFVRICGRLLASDLDLFKEEHE